MTGIRALTPDDWRIWRELRLAALAEAPEAFMSRLAEWTGEGDQEERWRLRLSLPGSVNLIALGAAGPAGMASGIPGGPGEAELISMWVSPAARGLGMGDRLIEAAADWATGMGAARLTLCVFEGNDRALTLYQRHGFAIAGESGGCEPGDARRMWRMVKALSPRAG